MGKTSIKQTRQLEELNKIVSLQGGKCLSCIYKNSVTPLEWECKRVHTWMMKPSYVKDGSWCKECKKIELLDEMKKYAESRGGKCLSTKFVTSKTKLLWECSNGHKWYSNSAKYNNSWCPICTSIFFLSEEKCRFILESVTGELFPKNRSVLGNGLELDGYCQKINVAFEYQGYQHFDRAFYDDADSFKCRIIRDTTKKKLCDEKGILLLIISHLNNNSEFSLFKHLLRQLKKNKINLITQTVDWNLFISEKDVIEELRELALKKGGKLISKSYLGVRSKLKLECSKKHEWRATPISLKSGHWCPKCNARAISERNKNSIVDVRGLANKNSSTLISRIYKNNITPLEWECKICHNHWDSTLNAMKTRLLKGKWCLFCKNKRRKK